MFSAIDAEKFFHIFSPDNLKQAIFKEHKKTGLKNEFRSANEESIIYNILPDLNNPERKFFDGDSVIEKLCGAVVYIAKYHTKQEAVNVIKAYLDMIPEHRIRELVNITFFAIMDPDAFKIPNDGYYKYANRTISPQDKKRLPEFKLEEFEMYYNMSTPKVRIYDLSPEKAAVFRIICTVFLKPESIARALDILLKSFHTKVITNNTPPRELAAFIHNGIINIHPFSDGNGRVARFMMNKVLSLYGMQPLNPKRDKLTERLYDKAVAANNIHVLVEWMQSEHQQLRTVAPKPVVMGAVNRTVIPRHNLLIGQPISKETENLAKKIIAFSIWKQTAVSQTPTMNTMPMPSRG